MGLKLKEAPSLLKRPSAQFLIYVLNNDPKSALSFFFSTFDEIAKNVENGRLDTGNLSQMLDIIFFIKAVQFTEIQG